MAKWFGQHQIAIIHQNVQKKKLVSLGQRYINITRNAIGPKSGQKDCKNKKKNNLIGLHRLDINDYLSTFFFIWCK